jgi:hypothetical protein
MRLANPLLLALAFNRNRRFGRRVRIGLLLRLARLNMINCARVPISLV